MIPTESLSERANQAVLVAGCDELSVLELCRWNSTASRLFTTLDTVFPLFGSKKLPDNQLTCRLIFEQEMVLTVGELQLKAVFPDFKRILDEGIFAIVNVPIVRNSVTVGSLNCMYRDANAPFPGVSEVKLLQALFSVEMTVLMKDS